MQRRQLYQLNIGRLHGQIDFGGVAEYVSRIVRGPRGGTVHQQQCLGVYFAPTTCRFKSAPTKYELFQTNTGEDFGIYYNRLLGRLTGRLIDVQIEARLSTRDLDIDFGDLSARINEEFIEIPLIIHGTIFRRVDNSMFRVFLGLGISYGVLIEQEIAAQGTRDLPPNINGVTDAGRYQKTSWLMDGGAAFTYTKRAGVFLSYRISSDWFTFEDSDDVPVIPEYISYGFQVGFEWRFGRARES